jgi:hypothetical protein
MRRRVNDSGELLSAIGMPACAFAPPLLKPRCHAFWPSLPTSASLTVMAKPAGNKQTSLLLAGGRRHRPAGPTAEGKKLFIAAVEWALKPSSVPRHQPGCTTKPAAAKSLRSNANASVMDIARMVANDVQSVREND